MHTFLEPRLRRMVAETLGVDAEDLSADVSLTDDLAADSLDLAEVAVRLESEFGVSVPDRIIDRIRTYGDLVRTTLALTRSAPLPPASGLIPVWARLVAAGGELLRAELLTPYVAETIAEDAIHAGRGARLEVMVRGGTPDAEVSRLRQQFAWLARHGIEVHVGREDRRIAA